MGNDSFLCSACGKVHRYLRPTSFEAARTELPVGNTASIRDESQLRRVLQAVLLDPQFLKALAGALMEIQITVPVPYTITHEVTRHPDA